MDQTFVIVDEAGTEHEFPVSMDPKRAAAIVRGEATGETPTTARGEDYYKPNVFQQDVGTSIGQAAVGAVKNVGGMGRQLLHMVTQSPVKTLQEATAARHAVLDRAETAESLPERIGYSIAGRIPFLGPMLATAGERLGSGDPEAMGAGASDVALMATASPTVRAGARSVGSTAADAVGRLPGASRVAPAVREAVKDPLVAAVGAYEGYRYGGLPGAVAGGLGAPIGVHGSLRTLGRILRGEQGAAAGSRTTGARPGEPRLNDPRLRQELEAEMRRRVDAIPNGAPAAVDDAAVAQATAGRLQDAVDSPVRIEARIGPDGQPVSQTPETDFMRPQAASPVEGARLNRNPEPGPTVNDALTEALQEVRRPESVDLGLSHPPGGGFTEPVVRGNPGGRLTPRPTPTASVEEALTEALSSGRQPASRTLPGSHSPGTEAGRTVDAMEHVRQALEARNQSGQPASAPARETPTPAAAAAPEPRQVGRSKTKRPTYSENDLRAAKEKWGSTDIADLREKYGEAVDAYLLEQRAARHQQHYSSERERAAARRADLDPLGSTATLAPDIRQMLLGSLRQRGNR